MLIDELARDFDPERSIVDRRLFYEVTGEKLIEGEFMDGETSDGEEEYASAEASSPRDVSDPFLVREPEGQRQATPGGTAIN